MDVRANQIIDALGGSTAVARMIEAPLSTVHSWRKIGIPQSRFAHLKLAANAAGHTLDLDDPDAVAIAAARRSKQEAA